MWVRIVSFVAVGAYQVPPSANWKEGMRYGHPVDVGWGERPSPCAGPAVPATPFCGVIPRNAPGNFNNAKLFEAKTFGR